MGVGEMKKVIEKLNFILKLVESNLSNTKIIELVYKECVDTIKEVECLQNRKCENCKFGKERYWDWDSGRFPFEKSFECNKLDKSGQLTPYSVYEEHKFYCSPNFYCINHELKD